MKPLTSIAFLLSCFTLLAADINITNVTKSATVPPGSYGLGTTGLVTRLLPMDLFPQLGASQTFTGSNNFSGGLAVNGVAVLTNASGGSQVWTNDALIYSRTSVRPVLSTYGVAIQDIDSASVTDNNDGLFQSVYSGNFTAASKGAYFSSLESWNNGEGTWPTNCYTALYGYGAFGGYFGSAATTGQDPARFDTVGVMAEGQGGTRHDYGIVALSYGYNGGDGNIAVAARAEPTSNSVALYGELASLSRSTNMPAFTNAVLLLEDASGTDPLILGRTNKITVFKVGPTGRVRIADTNSIVLTCPDGGSFILTVKNDGTLNVITNTGGL